LNVIEGDGVDAKEGFDGGEATAEGEELATDFARDFFGGVEGEEVGGLDAVFGAEKFSGGDGAEVGEFFHEFDAEFVDAVVGSDEGDTDEASSVVRGVVAVVGEGEAFVGGDFREAGVERVAAAEGVVPGANEGLDEEIGEIVGIRPGGALEGDGGSDVVEGIVANFDFRADEFRGRNRSGVEQG